MFYNSGGLYRSNSQKFRSQVRLKKHIFCKIVVVFIIIILYYIFLQPEKIAQTNVRPNQD